jgi:hypothetical protein
MILLSVDRLWIANYDDKILDIVRSIRNTILFLDQHNIHIIDVQSGDILM